MSTTRETIRGESDSRIEASSDPAAPFRDRVATRCAEHDAAWPRAVDLEAQVLQVMHAELHGVAAYLSGTSSSRRFREALMGERHFKLADLCRLATEPRREARAAARAAVREIAATLGLRVEPVAGAAANAHEAMAAVVETHGALVSELSRDLSDGHLSAEEARGLRPEIEAHKARLAQLERVVSNAEGR